MDSMIIFNRNDGVPAMYNTLSNFDEETGGHIIDFDLMLQFIFHHPEGDGFNTELLHAMYAIQQFLKFGNPERAKAAHQAILFQNKMCRMKYGMRPFVTSFIPYTPENAARLCDAIRECWDVVYDENDGGTQNSFLRTNFYQYIINH